MIGRVTHSVILLAKSLDDFLSYQPISWRRMACRNSFRMRYTYSKEIPSQSTKWRSSGMNWWIHYCGSGGQTIVTEGTHLILSRQIKASNKYKTKHPCDGCNNGTSNTKFIKSSFQHIWIPAEKKGAPSPWVLMILVLHFSFQIIFGWEK